MKVVEDLDPEALPQTTEESVHGARKFEQLGEDACDKVLQALLEGITFTERTAILVVDFSPDVGDMFRAFLSARARMTMPMYFFGACQHDVHRDWLKHHLTNSMAEMVKNQQLKVPGYTPKEDAPPESVLEATLPGLGDASCVNVG